MPFGISHQLQPTSPSHASLSVVGTGLIACLSFWSCTDRGTPVNPLVSQENLIREFPNHVGDTWTYRWTTNVGTTYSIEVQIIGQGTLPNGSSARIWTYAFENSFDTAWVSPQGNTVIIYDKPCWNCTNTMPHERLRYVFPLSVGNRRYTTEPRGDTTNILRLTNQTVPAGTFSDVFEISKTEGYITSSWTFDTLWFKENVGLIKKSQAEFELGAVRGNGIWELVSYSLQ